MVKYLLRIHIRPAVHNVCPPRDFSLNKLSPMENLNLAYISNSFVIYLLSNAHDKIPIVWSLF